MPDLPRLRIYLLEFDLVRCYRFSLAVEDKKSRTGSTLIDRTDKAFVSSHVRRRASRNGRS